MDNWVKISLFKHLKSLLILRVINVIVSLLRDVNTFVRLFYLILNVIKLILQT